ncbi:GFA family protein [Rhizobium sp. S152]|uniref:GFA family protein n=1 Tax=Rhizobium sp. S152 TaxID=3055038 RepID=UPI0025A95DD1|nr:GFA family protein [Rhizobium sp. S152]MDM9629186.1 GFA family protein [Rhizobium sp. S152]
MGDTLTGGCQCGAVRFAVRGPITNRAICHCRMCQKAVGSVSWPFFTVAMADIQWSRGKPSLFRSSEAATRGFCSHCGTPLTFEPVDDTTIDMSIGALDDPSAVEPVGQYYAHERVPWFDKQPNLPSLPNSASPEELERRRPYQHPDHDTTEWPVP